MHVCDVSFCMCNLIGYGKSDALACFVLVHRRPTSDGRLRHLESVSSIGFHLEHLENIHVGHFCSSER